jgi:Uma2 family endonuclease
MAVRVGISPVPRQNGIMTTLQTRPAPQTPGTGNEAPIPPLEAGDRLTRAEFERRYAAMPHVKKAELIEGRVYMPSPVSQENHGEQHFDVITWLGTYRAFTPGTRGGDNSTVRLDLDNEPQPDTFLMILPAHGGQAAVGSHGYVERAPELVVEVAASSVSYDLHEKLNAYRRNGVREYLVWRTLDHAFDWFVIREGRFEPLAPGEDGILRTEVFPGLWLDPAALLAGDLARVLAVLQQGIASEEHTAFVASLQQSASG